MGHRIPKDQLEKLKSEVSLLDLVRSQGYELKKQGKDYALRCPFHDDKTPSMMISPDKNVFHCFGCGASGTVIDWVMKTQGVSFRHAAELLLEGNPSLVASPNPVKTSRQRKLDGFEVGQSDAALMNQVIDFYHDTLLNTPEALAYLESRGLKNDELIKEFKLGFANRTLGYRLPQKRTKAGDSLRGQLTEIGLYRKTGHEHFNGSLIVPVIVDGEVKEVYGRKAQQVFHKGASLHLYLPGEHGGVWNQSGLTGYKEVILCEALIDAMTFWVHGFKNVTASYGTNGFTNDHLSLFKSLGVERVLIAYDRDEAGNKAAEELAKKLSKEDIACYRCHFPKGMDANQYTLEVTPAEKSLGVVIRSAEFMGSGKLPERQLDITMEVPAAPILASPVPPSPQEQVEPEISEHEINLALENRRYRVRGLQKNSSYDVLKINLLVEIDEVVTVDTFDLYSAKHRQQFIRLAASECGVDEKVLQRDLGKLLLQLEGLQDQAIQETLKPKEPEPYNMDEAEKTAALELLKDKNLTQKIIDDFAVTGLVGEPTNALMGYLAAVSRKLKTPLAIIVQSTSAAGKSALMDAVLNLVPEEDRVHYSAMTGQSLFYLGETNLKHKILGIAEEEGVRQAAYALKILQSSGELTIASTGKDPQSGKLVTEEYRVEGPVMLFLTTTAIDIDEELLNRCVVLTINESREQTAAIQQRQRQARTLEGLLASNQSDQLIQQHQNAQRLLKPLAVVNPYAEQLAFADSRTRTRRDHQKYLTLIDSIALLHQYQREVKTITHDGNVIEYVEVTLDDITLANELAHEILGRSLDELPPPTRKLLQQLHALVAEKMKVENLRQNEVRFTRKELRESAGLSNTQVRVHLDRLVELEYVLPHSGRNGKQFVYELVFDGEPDKHAPQLIGLIHVDELKSHSTIANLAAKNNDLAPSLRSTNGHLTGSLRTTQNSDKPSNDKACSKLSIDVDAVAPIGKKKTQHRSHSGGKEVTHALR